MAAAPDASSVPRNSTLEAESAKPWSSRLKSPDRGPGPLRWRPALRSSRPCGFSGRELGPVGLHDFHEQDLEEMVRQRPRTPHELAAIKGSWPVIRERYGLKLLEAIAEPTFRASPIPANAPRSPESSNRTETADRFAEQVPSPIVKPAEIPTKPESALHQPRSPCADRGMDLAGAGTRVQPGRRGGDPRVSRSADDRPPRDLDGSQRGIVIASRMAVRRDSCRDWERTLAVEARLAPPSEADDPTGLWPCSSPVERLGIPE